MPANQRGSIRRLFSHIGLTGFFPGSQEAIQPYLERNCPVALVVHVGAHLGEERDLYEQLGAEHIVWIEADPVIAARLLESLADAPKSKHTVIQAAASDSNGHRVSLYRYSNDGSSNSLHAPGARFHESFPDVAETGDTCQVQTMTLRKILHDLGLGPLPPSLLVIDVQGHELAVLHGLGEEWASQFSFVKIEVSERELYEAGAAARQVYEWLRRCSFEGITPLPAVHGDVLFRRRRHAGKRTSWKLPLLSTTILSRRSMFGWDSLRGRFATEAL